MKQLRPMGLSLALKISSLVKTKMVDFLTRNCHPCRYHGKKNRHLMQLFRVLYDHTFHTLESYLNFHRNNEASASFSSPDKHAVATDWSSSHSA